MTDDRLPLALTALLGTAGVIFDPFEMVPYLTDWRGQYHGRAVAVARPATTGEVISVVEFARKFDLSIVPQGGHTGLAAGATPDAGDRNLVVNLTRMNRIVEIDRVGMSVTVEAGATIDAVRARLREVGRDLPISFAASGSATVGDVIATNAGGANVVRYGMTGRSVLGLEAVLADGSVVGGGRPLHKDNSGMNLAQLLVGSEGTLGIITRAVMKTYPFPGHVAAALLAVPDPATALRVYEIAHDMVGERLSGFELMSEASVDLAERMLGVSFPVQRSPWLLLVEASSVSASVHQDFLEFVQAAMDKRLTDDGTIAASDEQVAAFWRLREGLTQAEARAGLSAKHDISVPVMQMPGFLAAAEAALERLDRRLKSNVFGHVGDGNLHFNVRELADTAIGEVNSLVHDVAVSFGGSISAEHGIGQYRLDEAYRVLPPEQLRLQERLKAALDPSGLFNPGKLIRPGR